MFSLPLKSSRELNEGRNSSKFHIPWPQGEASLMGRQALHTKEQRPSVNALLGRDRNENSMK